MAERGVQTRIPRTKRVLQPLDTRFSICHWPCMGPGADYGKLWQLTGHLLFMSCVDAAMLVSLFNDSDSDNWAMPNYAYICLLIASEKSMRLEYLRSHCIIVIVHINER